MTLKSGDIILTGTPPGVGVFLKPEPVFIKVRNHVTLKTEDIILAGTPPGVRVFLKPEPVFLKVRNQETIVCNAHDK